MKPEQQKQAENLYFETDLSKTEIAQLVGISRRTLHYWIQENQWDTIKQNAKAMPIALAGNCYLIMAKLQESILSPERADKPVTLQEVTAMHKLTVTIGKLRERSTLSENIEMMNYFIEFLNGTHPPLAEIVKPIVGEFLKHRATEQSVKPMPYSTNRATAAEQAEEDRLDQEDLAALARESAGIHPTSSSAATIQQTAPLTTSHIPDSVTPPYARTASTVNPPKPAGALHMHNGQPANRAARRAAARAAA